MSREIGFRAWDTGSNKWVSGLKMTLDGRLKDIDFDDEGRYEFEPRPEQYIIEQCTGLKDKNGKEIYEGDIVKWKDGKGSVFYEEDLARYSVYSKHGGISPLVGKKTKRHLMYEVIGNIHKEEK